MGPRRLLTAATVAAVLSVAPPPARADLLVYRCGPDVCRAAPDGTGERRLTRGGSPHTWLSASADGSRLAVVRGTFAYVLDSNGRTVSGPLPRGGTVVVAELSPDGLAVATIELLPEITPAPVGSPPGSPGIAGFQPYLFAAAPDGSGRDAVARAVVDTGWQAGRLARTDSGSAPPFPLGICLLAVNTDFACGSDVARDPTLDLFNPAFSPDGRLVAVVRAPSSELGAGPIVVHDVATGAPVRELAGGENTQPAWSPDGSRIAFERGGDIYVARAAGAPRARRVLKGGQQPTWTSAPACRPRRPRVRVRARAVLVIACAPQPGRVTVTLKAGSRRVGRRTVRAATGGTVTVRLRRPAGVRAGALRASVSEPRPSGSGPRRAVRRPPSGPRTR